MEKYIIFLAVIFAWEAYAQTTDTTTDVGVSDSEDIQRGITSTLTPSSTAILVETEPSSRVDPTEGGEATERTTQPSDEEDANRQVGEDAASEVQEEEATSSVSNQQQSEPGEGTTTAQSLPEETASEESTTPPVQQDVTSEATLQQEASSQSAAVPEVTTRVEVAGQENQQENANEQQENPASEVPVVSNLESSSTATTPSAAESETSTEPAVRAGVEDGAVTGLIETDVSTHPTAGEGGAEDAVKGDGAIDISGSECPTDCESGSGDPVCGSDQRVYESECHLKRDTCGKGITVASWELCRGKHEICPAHCLNIQDPVCGEDGKIYPNLCLMYKFNCGKRMGTYDLVRCVHSYRGFRRLDGACPKACHDLYRPVCGSDGNLYNNECYLRLQTCGRDVKVVDMSNCVDTPTCPHTCTPLYDPVCGSDGRMYLNHCYFSNLTCGKNIAKVDLRYCESFQHLK